MSLMGPRTLKRKNSQFQPAGAGHLLQIWPYNTRPYITLFCSTVKFWQCCSWGPIMHGALPVQACDEPTPHIRVMLIIGATTTHVVGVVLLSFGPSLTPVVSRLSRMVLWVWLCYPQLDQHVAVSDRSGSRVPDDARQCFDVSHHSEPFLSALHFFTFVNESYKSVYYFLKIKCSKFPIFGSTPKIKKRTDIESFFNLICKPMLFDFIEIVFR